MCQKVIDIALPNGNEKKFIEKYIELEYYGVVFLYRIKNKEDIEIFLNKEKIFSENNNIKIFFGALIDVQDIKEVRSLAAKLFYRKDLYNDLVFVYSKDFKFNRSISNIYFINGIINPGFLDVEDRLSYRYITLSTNTFKKLHENKLSIVISISDMIKSHKFIGRCIYIAKLARKYKVPIILASFSNNPDNIVDPAILKSFRSLLKIKEPSEKIFYKNIMIQIDRTRKAKNPLIFTEGFEVIKLPYEDCREY